MTKDFYSLLGVSPNFSMEELNSAFRKEALKWHPDKCPDITNPVRVKEYEEMMKKINTAFEWLKSEYEKTHPSKNTKRKREEATPEGSRSQKPNPFSGFDFDSQSSEKPQYDSYVLRPKVTLGHNLPEKKETTVMKLDISNANTYCFDVPLSLADIMKITKVVVLVTRKAIMEEKRRVTIELFFPAGIPDGYAISVHDAGNEYSPTIFSDLRFIAKQQPDPCFHRDGNNLLTTLEITAIEALTWFNKPIVLPNKKVINVKGERDKPYNPDIKLTYKGHGFPLFRKQIRGDFIVSFKTVFNVLSTSQKAEIRKIVQ